MPIITPLNRLIKPNALTRILTNFAQMQPGTELAVVQPNGQLLVSVGTWDDQLVAEIQAQHKPPGVSQVKGVTVCSLTVQEHHVGTLIANVPFDGPLLGCLHHSLTLLITQAQEKRDVVSEALERYREINLLYRIAEKIGTVLDLDTLPELVLSEAVRVIQCDVGAVVLSIAQDVSHLEIKASYGFDDTPTDLVEGAARYLIEQVYETNQPVIFTALSLVSSPTDVVLCVPLKIREQVLGVIFLGRSNKTMVFTASDEKLLTAIASQAAVAIETASLHQREIKRQRLEKELAVGQQIQLSLLPESTPSIPGWEFAAIYQSARQVGGDFYDFFDLPGSPKRLGMVIADVTGKGVPAALFMAFSRSIIRTTAMSGENPADVLARANHLIVQDNRSGVYLTAFYAILDIDKARLRFANGGHNWPFYQSASGGPCQELDPTGFLLGALPDINLEEQEIDIAPGDTFIFFTDGVPEAMNADNEMFGEERLQAVIQACASNKATAILDTIVNTVNTFTGDISQSDDFTLFVVKRQLTP